MVCSHGACLSKELASTGSTVLYETGKGLVILHGSI